jgi:23S rRNA (guanine745-N1)-methyltransferase
VASGRGSVGRVFRCPHCGAPLEIGERAWRCANGHSFDVARQGYVALERKAARGDTAEMVAARVAFLEAGHYSPIAEAVVAAAGLPEALGVVPPSGGEEGGGGESRRASVDLHNQGLCKSTLEGGCEASAGGGEAGGGAARTVVDLGAGPGYYLAAVLEAHRDARGIALDSSRPALRRAARAHPRITAIACDAWDALPLQDGTADVVLNVFAPRNPDEMRRVLKPDGRIVVVTPTDRHLKELELLSVHPDKRERLHKDLGTPEQERDLEFTLELDDVTPLVQMGPSAHHRLERRGPQRVTVSVTVSTFRG